MILKNSAICNNCKEEIESKHVHDMVYCKCGSIAVDGGRDYLKRTFIDPSDYKDTSIEDTGNHLTRRLHLRWGVNYTKQMKRLPETKWILIKDLNSEHIKAIIDGGYVDNNEFYMEVMMNELIYREYLEG